MQGVLALLTIRLDFSTAIFGIVYLSFGAFKGFPCRFSFLIKSVKMFIKRRVKS